jgi:alkanesulfonate monooxygenase SsuD/methylene tetrahydromethanopterin reductase-like flavin-dependent oxidoreductase (luciferase family)
VRPPERASVVSGSPDAVADRLAALVALGFGALNLMPSGPGGSEQVERLAEEVLPAVRAAAA